MLKTPGRALEIPPPELMTGARWHSRMKDASDRAELEFSNCDPDTGEGEFLEEVKVFLD